MERARTFTVAQMREWHLDHGEECAAFVDERAKEGADAATVYELVFRAPDDLLLWRIEYEGNGYDDDLLDGDKVGVQVAPQVVAVTVYVPVTNAARGTESNNQQGEEVG